MGDASIKPDLRKWSALTSMPLIRSCIRSSRSRTSGFGKWRAPGRLSWKWWRRRSRRRWRGRWCYRCIHTSSSYGLVAHHFLLLHHHDYLQILLLWTMMTIWHLQHRQLGLLVASLCMFSFYITWTFCFNDCMFYLYKMIWTLFVLYIVIIILLIFNYINV